MTTPNIVATRPLSSARTIVISQSAWLWIAVLTPLVLAVHGYHPFADDADIYVSGIRKLANPDLFRPDAAFVLAHTHLSLFAHLLAWTLRLTRLPIEPLLLAVHLVSVFLFLLACWTLAERIFPRLAQRWCAVTLAAACFTLPVAGTSLFVMDPFLTARSFSTPFGLFALAAAIDRRWWRCLIFLCISALMHPLMAAYTAAFITLFFLIDFGIPRAAFVISAQAMAAAAVLYFFTRHLPVAPAYREAVLSRRYLFPGRWTNPEYLGLGLPLILFAIALGRRKTDSLIRKLCLAACIFGITASLVAFLFIHPSGSLLIVRLQPLRSFHIIYTLGVVLLGGLLGSIFFASRRGLRSRWMAIALLSVVAAIFYLGQRATYPLSAHMELPDSAPRNPWQQAFAWISAHTPQDAVFAANPDRIFVAGEDAQGFRAAAGRSLLADDKDEGVVVVFPHLAQEWARQRNPQQNLETLTDTQRREKLGPLGATWLLLSRSAATALPCPYQNAVAKVCRLK